MSLFQIKTDPGIRYVAIDGQHWGSPEEAKRYNGEVMAVRVYGQKRLDRTRSGFTIIRNLSDDYVSNADVAMLVGMLDDYLEKILPEFEKLEGPFGWVKGERRFIETEDGWQHDDKFEAAKHVIILRLRAALPYMTRGLKVALSNGSRYNDKPISAYQIEQGLATFLEVKDSRGKAFPDNERRLRDALKAMLDARMAADNTVPVYNPRESRK